MHMMASRIILALLVLAIIIPSTIFAAAEQRTALVIGNSAYSSGPLKNPVNDATDMAATLKKHGFKVTLIKNAKLSDMDEAIEQFGNQLKRGGVGLFFYAGHGVQVNGVNYLLPTDARINKESDVKYKAVDANKVLDEMANANNGLNVVILDACRDNPFARSFRNASRGLAIVSSAPSGTFISYSTSPGNVARDGEGKNSPYTAALIESMKQPGLSIEQVFKHARVKLDRQTGGKQVPWELSSLRGDFFFAPGSGTKGFAVREDTADTTTATDALDDENRKLEAEQRRLESEKAALERQKALAEKRRQIEEEKERLEAEKEAQRQTELERKEAKKNKGRTTLAMGSRPSAPRGSEIRRDGRFIAYDNGTVLDTRTNLMWAAKDNGSDINWANAKSYCENYRGGGYTDWRMPTQDELAGLYDKSVGYTPTCAARGDNYKVHLTNLITMSCWVGWA